MFKVSTFTWKVKILVFARKTLFSKIHIFQMVYTILTPRKLIDTCSSLLKFTFSFVNHWFFTSCVKFFNVILYIVMLPHAKIHGSCMNSLSPFCRFLFGVYIYILQGCYYHSYVHLNLYFHGTGCGHVMEINICS